MGVVCRATSNSNSSGVGDEETEELIVDDGGGELASLVFSDMPRASANPKLFQSRGRSTHTCRSVIVISPSPRFSTVLELSFSAIAFPPATP